MPFAFGAILGFVFAFLIGSTFLEILGFTLAGLAAAYLGAARIGSVESFYWLMLAALVAGLILVFLGISVPRFFVFLPVVLIVCRLSAVWSAALVSNRRRR